MSKVMIESYMLKALEQSDIDLKNVLSRNLEQLNKNLENILSGNLDDIKNTNNAFLLFKVQTETVHWLVDCIERINIYKVSSEDRKIFSAFKFLNNALKHNNSLTYINITKGYFEFPNMTFPAPNKLEYQWADLSYLKDVKNDNQGKIYRECLEGNEILQTIESAILKINYYIKVKQ